MNIAMLRIEGSDSALVAIMKDVPLTVEFKWKKGDRRRNGEFYEASGMSATVVDANNPKELTDLVRGFLVKCIDKKINFSNHNLVAELSIGFTVGDSVQFVAGIDFSSEELSMLADCGIDLSISAYPTSDEENNENTT